LPIAFHSAWNQSHRTSSTKAYDIVVNTDAEVNVHLKSLIGYKRAGGGAAAAMETIEEAPPLIAGSPDLKWADASDG
jgi:hypothetical protein